MPSEQSILIRTANVSAVPGPRSYPIFGMLPHMWGGPHKFLLRTAMQYGNVARLWGSARLLISHPEGVKRVLLDNHHNYIKGKYAKKIQFMIGNGLPANEGASWLSQRRLMQPAFHRHQFASFATVITDMAATMIERWSALAANNRPFDVLAEMKILTQQIIVRLMFGAHLDAAEAESVGRAFTTIMAYFNYRQESLFPLPEHWPTPRNHRVRQAQELIDRCVSRIIEVRRSGATGATDLLSTLLAARDEETGEGMSEQQLRDEVRTIFISGYDSTSNVLAWVWHSLARFPNVEQLLHEELAAVLGGRMPSYEDLPRLTYLRMVIEETMRLYPPPWATGRTAIGDDEIDGYLIPAGTDIIVSPYVTHRLPSVWENPETFDPQRFAPERSAGRHRCAFFPFGFGPRVCIGNHLAMLEAQVIISAVAQFYRLRLVPGHRVLEYPIVLMGPRYGIRVTAHARTAGI
jgi:cytochrome P450